MITRTNQLDTLGTDVSHLDSLDEILDAAGANWDAIPMTPQVTVPFKLNGYTEYVPQDLPEVALMRGDTYAHLGTHKAGYVDIQNRQATEIALEAVGLRSDDSVVSHAGLMKGGKIFFANIDLGTLWLDPSGVNDEITRNLTVFTSHDGSLPVMILPMMFRPFCTNQLPAIRHEGRSRGFCAKHTKGVLDRLSMAKDALGIADHAESQFVKDAERLLSTPANHDSVKRVVNNVWKPEVSPSDRQVTVTANRLSAIMRGFDAVTNAPKIGKNMWAVYNAITEWEDHGRGTTPEKRALASVIPGNHVEKAKLRALEACLS